MVVKDIQLSRRRLHATVVLTRILNELASATPTCSSGRLAANRFHNDLYICRENMSHSSHLAVAYPVHFITKLFRPKCYKNLGTFMVIQKSTVMPKRYIQYSILKVSEDSSDMFERTPLPFGQYPLLVTLRSLNGS